MQLPGREHRAELLSHASSDAGDVMVLEMKDVFPAESDLASLRRTVALHRQAPAGWVELTDAARFATGPGTLESVLITFGEVDLEPPQVILRGERAALRVDYDPSTVDVRVECQEAVDLAEGPIDVRRIAFTWRAPQAEGSIRLRLTPA